MLPLQFTNSRTVMGTFRNLAVVGWREAPQADDIKRWRQLGHEMKKTHPRGTACLDLVVRGTPTFSEEMRREAEAFAADPEIFPLGIAHLVEIPGLAGTAVCAFISTIVLVARPPAPAKSFADIARASAWLSGRIAPAGEVTPIEIETACEALRTELQRSPPR